MAYDLAKKISAAKKYSDYLPWIEAALTQNKTSGDNHSEFYLHFTKMNVQRMKRLEKTTTIWPELIELAKNSQKKLLFLVLTEAWCGDAAQNLPPIYKLVREQPNWQMKTLWRDEHLDLMEDYKTEGGIAIPKVLLIDADTLDVLGNWGPRPEAAQQKVRDYKALEEKPPYEDFAKEMQLWYAKDKTQSLQKELLDWLSNLV
ncbi:thioredoxin family protein [Saprospira sp. CCB-QB6]|uniref:thioredoxin family protein n=1 Tax=Saprospira sp. CCB-QB6 TaxID=3023936 RepID=UPI00234BC707|nr:thioredoxin family protein [Saprospira sp. CCB-QB6]WCL81670.1 thioredoxin family protein [Saprospira sp. CCB-QB6]